MMKKRTFQEQELTMGSDHPFPLMSETSGHFLTTFGLTNFIGLGRPLPSVKTLWEHHKQFQLNHAIAAQERMLRQRQESLLAYQHQQREVHTRLLHSTMARQATTLALEQAMTQRTGLEQMFSPADRGSHDMNFERALQSLSGSVHRSTLAQFDDRSSLDGAPKRRSPSFNSDNSISKVRKDQEHEEEETSIHTTDVNEKFPVKLYRMLEEAEQNGDDNIVSFLPHGKAFIIHKPADFVSEIMPKYFHATRISSFQRQLNLYGFRRITEGKDQGGYFHALFAKGQKGSCKKIRRKRAAASKVPPTREAPPMTGNDSAHIDHLYSTLPRRYEGEFASDLQNLMAIIQDSSDTRRRQL